MIVVLFLAGGFCFVLFRDQGKSVSPADFGNQARAAGAGTGVGCIGRVEPEGGVIAVAATPLGGRVPVIAKLFVKEGQLVSAGDMIAILESLPELESAVRQASARIGVAQSRLDQQEAGPRKGDVQALRSELARLESEAAAAHRELEREEGLMQKDFVPRVRVDAARLKAQDADHFVEAARHRIESLTEVRESDLALAKAELAAAEADRDRARIERDAAIIRSPVRAWVIQIVARPGETAGAGGIVTLADTSHMNVIAEVYETDVVRVKVGQHAVVRSPSFPQPMEGSVAWISPEIENRITPIDPSAPADQRVYAARIRVNHPELLAQRIHARVDVLINP